MPACHETLFPLYTTRLRFPCNDRDSVDAVSSRHSEGKRKKSPSSPGMPPPLSAEDGRFSRREPDAPHRSAVAALCLKCLVCKPNSLLARTVFDVTLNVSPKKWNADVDIVTILVASTTFFGATPPCGFAQSALHNADLDVEGRDSPTLSRTANMPPSAKRQQRRGGLPVEMSFIFCH
jgi:hypothetical protein